MFGWFSDPASRDSRRNRCANSAESAWKLLSSLSATCTIQVGLPGHVHDRHAAATDLAQDLVATHRAHVITVSRDGAGDNR